MLTLPLLFLVTAASAQTLSQNCQQALTQVAANPDASNCLDPSALLQLAIGGTNASIIAPVKAWLGGICSAGPCSNNTIAAVVTNLTSGCSAELSAAGLTTDSSGVAAITTEIQAAYPTVRQVLCLSDNSNSGTNCIVELLTDIQNAAGATLSISEIISLVMNPTPQDVPTNVTCSDCSKAMYNVVNQNFPALLNDSTASVQATCGANFTDGQTPSSIVQTASSTGSSNNNKSGALPLSSSSGPFGLTVACLVTILAGFVFVA